MSRCLITITHRTVEHTDPDAAGFVDGYWWTVTDESERGKQYGRIESAAPTAELAEGYARQVATDHGYPDELIDVVVDGKLLKRKGDEKRVEKLIDANTA